IKAVRELGQNVVRQFGPYPGAGGGNLIGAVFSTRGPGMDGPLVDLLYYQMHSRVAKSGRDKR
ncbi:hypothetical protein ANACAC_03311, partial [Anaerostipes caccae L1-92]